MFEKKNKYLNISIDRLYFFNNYNITLKIFYKVRIFADIFYS